MCQTVQIGSLSVKYNDNDCSLKKIKKYNIKYSIMTIIDTLFIFAFIFMICYLPNLEWYNTLNWITKFFIVIIPMFFIISLNILVLHNFYDKKSDLYCFLEWVYRMQDVNICLNISKKKMFYKIKYKNSAYDTVTLKYILSTLKKCDLEQEDIEKIMDDEDFMKNLYILNIDLTNYPKVFVSTSKHKLQK